MKQKQNTHWILSMLQKARNVFWKHFTIAEGSRAAQFSGFSFWKLAFVPIDGASSSSVGESPSLIPFIPNGSQLRSRMFPLAAALLALLLSTVAFRAMPFSFPLPWSTPAPREFTLQLDRKFVPAAEVPRLTIPHARASDVEKVTFTTPKNKELPVKFSVLEHSDGITVLPQLEGEVHPGEYTATVTAFNGKRTVEIAETFSWGVIAVNVRQSPTTPGTSSDVHISVLDDYGRTVCDSTVVAVIAEPDGSVTEMSTADGGIISNSDCVDRSVTNEPDYHIPYTATLPGTYTVEVHATSVDGPRHTSIAFAVEDQLLFTVERTTFPTRIYPPADYPVAFTFIPTESFTGFVEETVPASFDISSVSDGGVIIEQDHEKTIQWHRTWQASVPYTLSYTFDAPNRSPLLHVLGPIRVLDVNGDQLFSESREWQIAADATKTWVGAIAGTWDTAANWSPVGEPANGDDIVFNGTSNGDSTWDNGSTSDSMASITATGYSGTFTMAKGGGDVTGDLDWTAPGNVTIGASQNFIIEDAITLNSSGTLSLGTNAWLTASSGGSGTVQITMGTLTMSSTSKLRLFGTRDFNSNETIESAEIWGDITVVSSDPWFEHLDVKSGESFSISSGRIVRTTAGGTGSLTLSGTIDGAGELYFLSSYAFPTTGTVTADVRFMSTFNDQTMSARTYGGDVHIYSNTTVARTITMGSGTHTVSGNLTLEAANTNTVALSGSTNNPTVNVSGNIDYTGTGSGSESIVTGTGTWTVSGSVDLTSGLLTATSGNTIAMNGTGTLTSNNQVLQGINLSGTVTLASATHTIRGNLDMEGGTVTPGTSTINKGGAGTTIKGGGNSLYTLSIVPSSPDGTITLTSSDLTVTNQLGVTSSDTLAISSGRRVTLNGTLILIGSITGPGALTYKSSTAFPTGGTFTADLRMDATNNNQTLGVRTYGGSVECYNNSTTARSVIFSSGTTTISGNLHVNAANTANVTCDADTNDATLTVTGNLDFTGVGSGTEIFTSGPASATMTIGGSVDFTDGTYTPTTGAAGSVINMNGSGTLTTGGQSLNNIALSGSITLANATHTVLGSLDMTGGTVTAGTSTIVMATANRTITGGGNSLYNLTIDPTSAGSVTAQTSDVGVSGTLQVADGDTLSIASGRTVTLSGNSGTTLNFNTSGTISGAGRLTYRNSATAFPAGGTVSSIVRLDAVNGNVTLAARTFGGLVEVFNDTGTARSITPAAGTHTFSSALNLLADGSANVTFAGATNNPTINITGNLDFTGTGGGTEVITSGTGTWTVSGNVDFTSGTYTAISGNTFAMDGSSKSITSASQTLQNFGATGGSVSNIDALDVNGTFDVSGAATFTQGANVDLNVAGNFTLASGTTFTKASGTGRVILDGDLTFDDNTSPQQNLGDVEIGTSPDTTDLDSDLTADSLLVNSGDVLNTNGYDLDIGSDGVTIDGTLDATDDVETDETMINVEGNFTINSAATFTQDQSTLTFDASSGTSDLVTDGSFALYNLVLSDGGGSLTVEVEDALDVDNDLTITGGTLDAKSGEDNAITVGGSWDNDDTFQARSGTVTLDAASGTETIDADGTGTDAFNDLNFNDGGGSATYQLTTSLDVDGDVFIEAGTFDANGNTVTVAGDWNNTDTFTHGNSTVTLDGSAAQELDGLLSGSNAFYNLAITNTSGSHSGCSTSFTPGVNFVEEVETANDYTITTGGVRVQYNSGSTYTFQNINWDGGGTDIIFRNSNLTSGTWLLVVNGTQTAVTNVDVARSDASGGNTILANDGTNTDCSNNTNWQFVTDFSGVVYTDEGVSPLDGSSVNKTVNLRVNGAGSHTDEITASDGAWSITGLSVSTGDIVTVYVDDETEEATLVFVSDGSTLTDVDLYEDRLILRAETGSLTNANLATGDDGDDDVKYLVTGADVATESGVELHIWAGDTFAPGGQVFENGSGGIHIDTGATFNAAGNDIETDGAWDNDGIYTPGSNTTTFDATSGTVTVDALGSGASAFNNLTFGTTGSAATWQLTTVLDVDASLVIDDGELQSQGNAINAGAWTNDGSYVHGNNTVTLDAASGSNTLDASGTGSSAFYNLVFNDGGGSATWLMSGGAIDIDNDVTITGGTFDPSVNNYAVTVGGSWSNSDTYVARSSVVTFDAASGSQTIDQGGNGTMFLARFNDGGGGATWTLTGDFAVNHDFELLSGTLDANVAGNHWITVGRHWENTGGTFEARQGNVNMTGSFANANIESTGAVKATFYDLTIDDVANERTFTLESALDVENDLTITDGDLDVKSGEDNAITVAGSWINQDTFTPRGGTVTFDAGSGTEVINSTGATAAAFNNVVLNDGGGTATFQLSSTLDVNGDLTITGGTLAGNANAITLAGNWTNNDTFTHGSGSVTFDGSTEQEVAGTLSGSSSFYDLDITNTSGAHSGCSTSFTPGVDFGASATIANNYDITAGGVRVEYESGATYTAQNINWDGGGTDIIFRNSNLTSGTWLLVVNGTQTAVTNVDVARSDASGGNTIIASDGTNTDCSNNTNWQFSAELSGVVYTDEGVTPLDGSSVNKTVNLRVNGAGAHTDEITASDGAWTITGLSVGNGDIITVYLDDETEEATTVLVSDGANLTDLDLYQDRVIARAETGSLTNANMATGDDADDDVKYNVAVVDLTVDSGFELHVWTGDSYIPGGTITTQGGGDVHIGTSATFDAESNDITINGSWQNDGSYTYVANQVAFTASSGTESIDSGGDPFGSLSFDDSGGGATWLLESDLESTVNFTLTSGTLDVDAGNNYAVSVGKNWTNSGATFEARAGTVTMTGPAKGVHNIDNTGAVQSDFYNLVFDDGVNERTYTLESPIVVSNDLTITDGDVDTKSGEDNQITIGGSWTNSDTFTPQNGLVLFDATSGTETIDSTGAAAASFYDIEFNDGGGSATWQLSSVMDVDNDFTITGGTVDANGNNMTVAGSWDNDDAFTHGNNTVTLDGTSGVITFSPWSGATADPRFHNLVIDDAGGSAHYALNTTLKVDNDLTITDGTLDPLLNSPIEIGGNYTNNDTYVTRGSTVRFTATSGTHTVDIGGDPIYYAYYGFSGGTATWLLADDFETDHTLRMDAGTLDVDVTNNYGITVGRSWENTGAAFEARNGTVTFDPGLAGAIVQTNGEDFYDVDFNNASGDWTVQTDDVSVLDDLSLTAASSFTVQSGRTIEVNGDFTNSVGGAATTWTGTTLYLNGSGGLYDVNTRSAGSDTYDTLRIGSSEDIGLWDSSASTTTIDSGGCLYSQDHAGTTGELFIDGACNSRTNEYWSYATDFDGTDISGGSERQADVQFADGATMTVDTGDTLTILGEGASSNRTILTRESTGNFGVTVNGTISAQFYDFDYLNASGLNITSTATVTELSDGSFDNIASGASASYITVSGITSVKTFVNNVFDETGDGTDSNVVYNVNASGSGIDWDFIPATGNRAGEDYDREVSGASVSWAEFSAVNDGSGSDVDATNSTTQLSANWTYGPTTGLDHYEYAIGTTAGGTDIVGYTSTGMTTNITKTGLSLTNGTTYYVTVRALTAGGGIIHQKSSDGITVDTTAPTYSNIQITVSGTSVTITWTSSEPTTSQVNYGLTSGYGSSTTEDTTLTTSHSVTITGLAPDTLYHFQVSGSDEAGNLAVSSDQTATTDPLESTVITNVQVTRLSSTSVKVTWTTNHPADSKVRYGFSTDYGLEVYDEALVTDHAVILTGLTPGRQYHYEVISQGNTTAIDADATFSTDTEGGPIPAPTIHQPKENEIVFTTRPLIEGFARSSNDVFLLIDQELAGVIRATDHTSGTGHFVYRNIAPLDWGWHTLIARARSADGTVVSDETVPFDFKVDPPYPTPILHTITVESAASPTLIVDGFARHDATLEFFLGDTLVTTLPSVQHESGTAYFRVTFTGDPGTHELTVVGVHPSGKRSNPTTPRTVTLTSTGGSVEPGEDEYTVQQGDSLWSIAQSFYDNARRWFDIQWANRERHPSLLVNPSVIIPGWLLFIP